MSIWSGLYVLFSSVEKELPMKNWTHPLLLLTLSDSIQYNINEVVLKLCFITWKFFYFTFCAFASGIILILIPAREKDQIASNCSAVSN